MNENDVLFQKVTQAYSEKRPSLMALAPTSLRTSNRKVLGSTPDKSTRISFFPSMPVSPSGIIHHSHFFIVFNKTIIPLTLAGYKMIDSQLGATCFVGYLLSHIQLVLVE